MAVRKFSVNLTEHVDNILNEIKQLTGDTFTTTLYRAVELYALVRKVQSEGGKVYIESSDGERTLVHLL